MSTTTSDTLRTVKAGNARLLRELEGLRKDRARLDWLEANPSSIDYYLRADPSGEDTIPTWLVQSALLNTARANVRDAIDAAMEASK